ncbi:MAG: hypothetical protein FWB76_08355 [Oscillospiraceae bacterium]|nr:hypothetical protein [Oscillospiraceae bacterium]
MKIFALLLAVALLLVACAAPAVEPAPTTTEEPTTAYITTTQEPTTVFEPRYLTEAEINEIFQSAWHAHGMCSNISYVSWQDYVQIDRWTYFRLIGENVPQSLTELQVVLHEHFSPELTQEIMNLYGFPIHVEHNGALYAVTTGERGSWRASINNIELVEQTDTHKIYHLTLFGEEWYRDAFTEPLDEVHIFTRELIDGRWVFTQFPFYW